MKTFLKDSLTNLLRFFSRNILLNILIRNASKFFVKKTNSFYQLVTMKWPVRGIVMCSFNNTKFKLYSKGDCEAANVFFYDKKSNESSEITLMMILSQYSKTIIDIGAYTGFYSILLSKANPAAKIYTIEPYEPNYLRTKKNIELNEITNISTHQLAMGSEIGTLELFVPANNIVKEVPSANSAFPKMFHPKLKWKSITVKKTSLNDFVSEIGETIDLIKCDVETYEVEVFKGAGDVLKNHKPTIIFECFLDWDDTKSDFFNKILREYNYYLYLVLENGIVRSDHGFQKKHVSIGNFLISPVKSSDSYLSHDDIAKNPGEILFRPNSIK
jgi:FkbM family methyltransferase